MCGVIGARVARCDELIFHPRVQEGVHQVLPILGVMYVIHVVVIDVIEDR